ncbi:MAG: hypothetical protein KDB71_03370 [Mycobacterium sp.]|nr:hypothetical protein [Mycobacterium sp.]
MRKPISGSLAAVIAAGAFAAGCSPHETPSSTTSSPRGATVPPNATPTAKAIIGNLPPREFHANMNAADGIVALQSEGYSVQINWGGGRTDQPLSMCRIGGVDGLRGSGAVEPGTTVYLTVIC